MQLSDAFRYAPRVIPHLLRSAQAHRPKMGKMGPAESLMFAGCLCVKGHDFMILICFKHITTISKSGEISERIYRTDIRIDHNIKAFNQGFSLAILVRFGGNHGKEQKSYAQTVPCD